MINNCLKFMFAVLLLVAGFPAIADSLPRAVLGLIPGGYALMTSVTGDLNADGLADYVLVVRDTNEATLLAKGKEYKNRELFVVSQGPANTFRVLERNASVVFEAAEGGQCDPFMFAEEGLVIKGAFFTVQNAVACGDHWTDFITFKYSPHLKRMVFHKRVMESWTMSSSNNPNAEALIRSGHHVISGRPTKPVLLSDYVLER